MNVLSVKRLCAGCALFFSVWLTEMFMFLVAFGVVATLPCCSLCLLSAPLSFVTAPYVPDSSLSVKVAALLQA
jgi:hypothetical protein